MGHVIEELGDRVIERRWLTCIYEVRDGNMLLGWLRRERLPDWWWTSKEQDVPETWMPCADEDAGIKYLTGIDMYPRLSQDQMAAVLLQIARFGLQAVDGNRRWESYFDDKIGDDPAEVVFGAIKGIEELLARVPALKGAVGRAEHLSLPIGMLVGDGEMN